MKSAATGGISGCIIWVIVFVFLLGCLIPTAMAIGGITSTVSGDFVAGVLESYLCPEGSKGEIVTHQTTSADEFGNQQPATAYEMQCVNASGQITREPSPDYGFIWTGLFGVVGLILAALFAFLLAAPAGLLIGRLFGGRKKSPENI
jgi:hypothetical protein